MSIANKLLTIAHNTPDVCEKLKSSKMEVSGSVISVSDVNETVHDVEVNLTSDTITDFSGITVSRFGKNLIPYPYYYDSRHINGVDCTINEDKTVTVNGTSTGNVFFQLQAKSCTIPKGSYFLSGCPAGGTGSTYSLYAVGYDSSGKEIFRKSDYGSGITITNPVDKATLSVIIFILPNTTVNNLTFRPQIEVGTTKTEYEQYITPQTEIAEVDGAVNGITSISPNMTLLCDTSGMTINAKYISTSGSADTEKISALNEAFANAKAVIQELRM